MRSNCVAVLALSFALAATGCHKRGVLRPVATQPPPPVSAPPDPVVSPLDLAERAFTSGNYDEASRGFENYLRVTPSGTGRRDEALFHFALTFVLRPAPATDWQRALTNFKQLIDEFPDSLLRPQVNLIIAMRAELDQAAADVKTRDQKVKQLTTELDRLKKIDVDRRKRP